MKYTSKETQLVRCTNIKLQLKMDKCNRHTRISAYPMNGSASQVQIYH